MRRVTAQMSAGDRVTVPGSLRASYELGPGTTLVSRENDRGKVHLLPEPASATRPDAVPPPAGTDPIGDGLVAEDERTTSNP